MSLEPLDLPLAPSAESITNNDQSKNIHFDEDDDDEVQPGINVACPVAAPTDGDHGSPKHLGLHSPPDSNSAMKLDGSDSELSDVEDPTLDPTLDPDHCSRHNKPEPSQQQKPPSSEQQPVDGDDEDIGDVTPDHWSGTVPVFKPDMHQFKDFKKFMAKIDSYGMKSGIVKVIPPQEWKDNLPVLDELVKQVRVREPIKQDIMGSNGTYRQVNILHQRSYNLPQWRQLCDQSEHQPPARRGERRAQAPPKPKPVKDSTSTGPVRRSASGRGPGRPPKNTRAKRGGVKDDERPMTPVSPRPSESIVDSVEQDPGADLDDDEDDAPRPVGRMGGMKVAKAPQEQSTSARRKYARREGSARIDEEAFKDFDYQMDISDYTPEKCEELERAYWRQLTYAPPLYGADVLGTLFDDSTDIWNLNKLPNLLDVLGTKVPGVNTAYLYLGMWKATFAWHLEDVDLYSINYLHFGAPKQWYSISQGDARRFEAAMKSIWPTDAKACDQFLRHKAFLISPNHLQQHFNIKVNKCVSYPGEFVVTYPYGYHSGYNLGYNCAEAVNFALDSWLPMGKIAKKCECAQAQDSVWIDVYAIERKLRGEETDYEETEDEEEEEEEEDEEDEEPTPRSSHHIKFKVAGTKRKRTATDKGAKNTKKKIRLRLKSHIEPPCCLCPHDIPTAELLPTDDNRKAHRLCALYGAETWIETVDGTETVANVANISKARLELKCLFCRSKRGACFQCSERKCARAYHATCAAAAGVLVEEAEIPIFGEDGTEYKEQAFEFTCRFHRSKRDRKLDFNTLDDHQETNAAAKVVQKGDIRQFQYHRGEIFAGAILENRADEQTFLVDVLPNGGPMEVEWKWLLLPNPADLHLPHASSKAIPMPTSRKAKEHINATKKETEKLPRNHDVFVDGGFTWCEFNHHELVPNKFQVKVDLSKENQVWHYLGKFSTDARPQYTEDPKKPIHNYKSNFLDTIPQPPAPPPQARRPYGSTFSISTPLVPATKFEKPYEYKPRNPMPPVHKNNNTNTTTTTTNNNRPQYTAQQFTPNPLPYTPQQFVPTGSPYSSSLFHQHTSQPASNTTPGYSAPQSAAQPAIPAPLPYYSYQHSSSLPRPYQAKQPQNQTPSVKRAGSGQQVFSASPIPAPVSQHTPYQPNRGSTPVATHPAGYNAQRRPSLVQQSQQAQNVLPKLMHMQGVPQGTPMATNRPTMTATTQSVSRPSVSRPSVPSGGNGHTRNKSSMSSYSGRLGIGAGQRMGTPPATYGHTRADSNTKSPFSHGFTQPPGLGPSPSPQNGQLFQAQARARSSSLASSISLNTPMTSSAIRPGSATSAQKLAGQLQSIVSANSPKESHPNSYLKSAFFQMHHNRDSSTYKTPYATCGGFTNGYEGNLRAHLLQSPEALFNIRRPSIGVNGTTAGLSSVPRAPSRSASSGYNPVQGHPSTLAAPFGTQAASSTATWQATPPSSSDGSRRFDEFGAALHPAIRAHYATMLQKNHTQTATSPLEARGPQTHNVVPAPTSLSPSPSTPAPMSSSAVPFRASSASKSTTPIPPPAIPATPASSGPAAKPVVPVATKQTYVPPPRPWESIRKQQPPVQPATPQISSAPPATTSHVPLPQTPSSPCHGLEVAGTLDFAAGVQPVHGQSAESRLRAVQQPEGSVEGCAAPEAAQQSHSSPSPRDAPLPPSPPELRDDSSVSELSTSTRRDAGESTVIGVADMEAPRVAVPAVVVPEDGPPIVPVAPTTTLCWQTVGQTELPEVSDGSMELVESIIRNAQKASGSYVESCV